MAIFQKSVLKKHIDFVLEYKAKEAFNKFREVYNAEQIEVIKNMREEEYQDGFLRDIFVTTLNYWLKPTANFNLVREQRNETNAGKADGAVVKNNQIIAVIELKSTATIDLRDAVKQAFAYKHSHSACKYVIVSNFEKLQFFVDDTTEKEEFNLFEMALGNEDEVYERFVRFFLILNKESLLSDLPSKLKQETFFHEQSITEELYQKYSDFKNKIYEQLLAANPNYDKLLIYRKTQKLLDRLLFIFFAEDKALIPPNTIGKIISDWHRLNELRRPEPLYNLFREFFSYLNTGGEIPGFGEIPAYNGGLFSTDEVLDNPNLVIADGLLLNNAPVFSAYDFASEVDVNILGHIFEHSISEFEEISAQLKGEEVEQIATKRKKDGIFYTPKYITKYIINSTLGLLCEEKKQELQLVNLEIDQSYFTTSKKLNKQGENLLSNLQNYKTWLFGLKIIDPACGSGAFLNQALEFLIDEHKQLNSLFEKLHKKNEFTEIDKQVLEKNIFGVDINEESVEIAKLSLWLRTAQKGRKLSDLTKNIRCGNSLINDKSIAGETAFDWNTEFAQIMNSGGFDVVVGNPPYITFALGSKQKQNIDTVNYLKEIYPNSSVYKVSSYLIFIEKGLSIMRKNGVISYIIPNTYHTNYYYSAFRKNLIDNFHVFSLLDVRYKVFADAEMGYTSIPTIRKQIPGKTTLMSRINNEEEFKQIKYFEINQKFFNEFPDTKFLFEKEVMEIWFKSIKSCITLGNPGHFIFYNGTKTGNNEKYIIETNNNQYCKPVIRGKDFYKYKQAECKRYIVFNKEELWSNVNEAHFIVPEKLLIRRTSDHLVVTYDNRQLYVIDTVHLMYCHSGAYSLHYILALLNSKLFQLLYNLIVPEEGKAFAEVKIVNLKKLPIKPINTEAQSIFTNLATEMLLLNEKLQTEKKNFIKSAEEEFGLQKITNKLESFNEYGYDAFKQELTKQNIKISLGQKNNEWREYFEKSKLAVNELHNKIQATDNEINKIVYVLYELNDGEIETVENFAKTLV
ncbi:MAG TPA: restriction endonuclease subunit M [Bacteroidales bacterium]|nr:restriction endonuclease subunit M [Bacteroidales bacterium]